jgi:hypothetical protein
MMEKHISHQELLREVVQFKEWSGPKIAKVFRKTGVPGYELAPIGSGGFICYRDKYFFVTNNHVVQTIEEGNILENIVVPFSDHGKIIVQFVRCESDPDNDISVLEIDQQFAQSKSDKLFIDSKCFEDPKNYLNRCNFVFIHGFPSANTHIDNVEKVVETVSLPYVTFIKHYYEESNLISLFCENDGNIDEFQKKVQLPELYGMSGSIVFSYRLGDVMYPYGVLGVVTNGTLSSETIWLTPIDDVISFIDSNFF